MKISRLSKMLIVIIFLIANGVFGLNITAFNEESLQTEQNNSLQSLSNYKKTLFASYNTSYFIDDDSNLWVWGYVYDINLKTPFKTNVRINTIGSVGDSFVGVNDKDELHIYIPLYEGTSGDDVYKGFHNYALLGSNLKVNSSSISYDHYIDSNNSLWMRGSNECGQLGLGYIDEEYRSEFIKVKDGVTFADFNGSDVLLIDQQGNLYGWGCNYNYGLGLSHSDMVITPTLIMSNVKEARLNGNLALKTDSSLWHWGINRFWSDEVENIVSPRKISDSVFNFSINNNLLMFVTTDGKLWGIGNNDDQLINTATNNYYYDTPVFIANNMYEVAVGNQYVLAKKTDGEIFTWGLNPSGQLGNGRMSTYNNPIKIQNNIVKVFSSNETTFYIDSNSNLFSFGEALVKGSSNYFYQKSANPIKIFENSKDVSFNRSWYNEALYVIDNQNKLWGLGQADAPDGSFLSYSDFTHVFSDVKTIKQGLNHSAIITTSNQLKLWGSDWYGKLNEYGQLGTGNTSYTHGIVTALDNVIKVEVNEDSTFAIKDDNSLWTWGNNEYGQLADGTTTHRSIPTKVMENVKDVRYINGATYILKTDGTLWLVGEVYGEYDLEIVLTPRLLFDQVAEFNLCDSYYCYDDNIAVIRNDKSLWIKGYNDSGQLGTGDFKSMDEFVKVMDSVSKIELNGDYSFAIKEDNTLWAWGLNSQGSLGLGYYDEVRVPTSIGYLIPDFSGFKIRTLPTKLQYLNYEYLDLTGGTIEYKNSKGELFVLPFNHESIMIYGYDEYSTNYGPQTVTVRWNEFETSFQVYLNRFSDVPYGHRNYAHINALVELGIINGYSDSTFRPNNTLTRAQAAIMIARAIGLSTEGVSSNFTDVPSTHAAYKFISAAQNAGIINGYSDGTFRPNASITRAQIAIMVQRAFQVQASGTPISFIDVPVGYAPKSFIETLASQRIVNGYSDGTFKPTNNVTRAQFSTMINNAIEYSKKR